MSPQLRVLNLFLRTLVRPYLARSTDPAALRDTFEAWAGRLFRSPRGATFREEAGPPRLLWTGPQGGDAALMHLHGGAFVAGSPRTHAHLGAALADAAGVACALPWYRMLPDHPHPAALQDALAAYAALTRRFARVAVSGDSAGGGLAFALIAAARAAGLPDPACVVGFSPWADMTAENPAIAANAQVEAMLPVARIAEIAALRMAGADPRDPSASPVFARFDRPPPPALIFASRREALAGDAEALAATLARDGGAVRLVWSDAAPHAWALFRGLLPEADAATAEAGAFVIDHLRGAGA